VKSPAVLAALLCAMSGAAAQNAAVPPAKPVSAAHAAPRRAPPPLVVPQELAPPQEAYASFPVSAAAAVPAAPAPPSACQSRLAKVATFRPLGVLIGAGECGAVDAVLLDAIVMPDQARLAVSPPATLRCPMAEQIAQWVRDDVAPTAIERGVTLRGLDNFDSYECRGRNRVRGATLSEHGRADALDVRGFKLADGRLIGLTDATVDKSWRETIRASVCARFSTVLGPGSDGEHEQHIHLDLAERHNNYKICEWDVRAPVMVAAAPEGGTAAPQQPTSPLDEVPLPRPRPVAANGRRPD